MHVFTYGSLMYPEVFTAVTGLTLRCTNATLIGWRRYALADRTYPGALPSDQPSDSIVGVVWLQVHPQAISALDRFEGDEYERVAVRIITAEGQSLTAQVYQWRLPKLAAGIWDTDEFERKHLANFFEQHRG